MYFYSFWSSLPNRFDVNSKLKEGKDIRDNLNMICTNIIEISQKMIYVGIIDQGGKLLVGKWRNKNIENNMMTILHQSQYIDTNEIYNVLRNVNNKVNNLKPDIFDYAIIRKDHFKLIIIPLSNKRTKYICIFIISDKSIKNLVPKILRIIS